MNLLEAKGIESGYGRTSILFNIDLRIEEGVAPVLMVDEVLEVEMDAEHHADHQHHRRTGHDAELFLLAPAQLLAPRQ